MPGIAGMISKGTLKPPASLLQRMVRPMMHEPFYTSGMYQNEGLGVSVGWVQLQGSFSDCMPIWNRTRDLCLVFSGEHFDGPGSSGGNGGAPDARRLMQLVEEHGREFLKRLNGWYSGLLIDLRAKKVLLFNDRYGMQRIYWYERKDAFFFASEAKALLAVCPELRRLDMKSLGEIFSFGCVLENRTLFEGVSLLPPGSAWNFRKERADRERYFSPEEWEARPRLGKEEFYGRLREIFAGIVPGYVKTNQRTGISLTGGLDTRMILANISLHGNALQCYTFGGMYHDCYDVKIGRKIANLCGRPHRVLNVDETFLSQFPDLAEKTVFITDGNMDVSGAADLYVNGIAREIAPVRLTGNYGSEILRGSRHLKARPACPGLLDEGFEKHVAAAADTLAAQYRGRRVTFAAFKQAPWYHYNRLALEQSQLTLRSPFLDNELVGLMYEAPEEVMDSGEASFRLINDGNPGLGKLMTDRGLGGNLPYPLSKAAWLYHEFFFKADYAFNYGMPPWLATLDHYLLAPFHVERLFLGRHKFHHFRVWFRDQLAGYVKDILLDRRSLNRPYLNGKAAEKIVLDHTSGRRNYTTEITKLLTAELLQRKLIEELP